MLPPDPPGCPRPPRIRRPPLRSPRRLSPVPPGASHRPRRPRDTRPPAGLGRAGSPAVRRSGVARAEGAGGRRFAVHGHHLEATVATGWQRGGSTATAGQGRGPAGAAAAAAPGQAGSGRRFPQARAPVSALLSRRDPSPWPLPEAGTGPPARPVPAPSPSHSAIARAPAPAQPEAAVALVRPRPQRCGAVGSGAVRPDRARSTCRGGRPRPSCAGPAAPPCRLARRVTCRRGRHGSTRGGQRLRTDLLPGCASFAFPRGPRKARSYRGTALAQRLCRAAPPSGSGCRGRAV